MTTLYVATDDGLAIVAASEANAGWRVEWALTGKEAQCVAVDPRRSERVYCGTFGDGLWRSGDAGRTWEALHVTWHDGRSASPYVHALVAVN
jgi:hypothetical protein